MMKLTVEQLLEATGGRLIQGSPEIEITGISTDTRTLSPGVLFVPLAGENFNGHDFISNAVAQGARGYLQHQDQGNAPVRGFCHSGRGYPAGLNGHQPLLP